VSARASTVRARHAAAERRLRPPPPRRVSGPVASRPPARAAPLATGAPASRRLDRLLRGEAWILLVGALLVGIVAMQVSLLQLNTGISRAAEQAAALERRNAALRAEVSTLSSGERVQEEAARLGLVMPAPRAVRYLSADTGAARRALATMREPVPAPAPVAVALAGGSAPPALEQ